MAFKYSCFISYRRVDGQLAKQFIDGLKKALEDYLSPYAEETKVYLDETSAPPARLDATLAQKLCESVMMVLVFTPGYFDPQNTWCALEYEAMLRLEEARLAALPKNAATHQHGLIVPVVFRGPSAIPDEIKKRRLYTDFSKFSLLDPDISKHPQYVPTIEKIAQNFYEIWQDFERLELTGGNPCSECDTFALKAPADVVQMVQSFRAARLGAPVNHEVKR